MKYIKKIEIGLISILTMMMCWNGSMVDNNSGKTKRPEVNFYGTINNDQSAEDILIGGRYKQIPVYSADSDPNIDPTTNKTLLDLDEIETIELQNADHPTKHQTKIGNKNYCTITIKSITGSIKNYIIESNREISYVRIDDGPNHDAVNAILEERKLQMIHLKIMKIKGKKGVQDQYKPSPAKEDRSNGPSEIARKTEEIIDAIEKNVENLNETSNFTKFKNSLATLLRSLRDQIQNMLSLMKK